MAMLCESKKEDKVRSGARSGEEPTSSRQRRMPVFVPESSKELWHTKVSRQSSNEASPRLSDAIAEAKPRGDLGGEREREAILAALWYHTKESKCAERQPRMQKIISVLAEEAAAGLFTEPPRARARSKDDCARPAAGALFSPRRVRDAGRRIRLAARPTSGPEEFEGFSREGSRMLFRLAELVAMSDGTSCQAALQSLWRHVANEEENAPPRVMPGDMSPSGDLDTEFGEAVVYR